jgi:hypothetical protein
MMRLIEREAEVAFDCQAIQETLTETGGEVSRLGEAAQRHLDSCPDCCEIAAAEKALGLIFREAVPPADPSIEIAVLAALRPVRIRRRIVAFMPVAASLLVALVGVVLVGGIPGSGIAGLLPGWSAQSWAALVGAVSDWRVAVDTGIRAAAAAIDPGVLAAAGLLGLLGLVGVVFTALRWRRISPWRNDG